MQKLAVFDRNYSTLNMKQPTVRRFQSESNLEYLLNRRIHNILLRSGVENNIHGANRREALPLAALVNREDRELQAHQETGANQHDRIKLIDN